VHSDWSYDGTWALADIAAAFGERDYRIVLMAEHDRGFDEDRWHAYRIACGQASSSELTLVPGIEYSDPENRVHLPTWGAMPFLGAGRAVPETLQSVRSHGGVAILAHPGRRAAWHAVEPDWIRDLFGVEAWNARYGGAERSSAALELLNRYPSLVPFACLDFHQASDLQPLAMELDLPFVTPEAVYGALAAGRCTVAVAPATPSQ
jgi:hypothetical protein